LALHGWEECTIGSLIAMPGVVFVATIGPSWAVPDPTGETTH
jgi:hypothetical protein